MSFVPTFAQYAKMLHNLSQFIEKGAAFAVEKKFDVEVLLNARLAPDQFSFTRQVQTVCDTAKFGAARLAGQEAPAHADTEKTVEELQARIRSVINYLETFTEADFAGADERRISPPRWAGKSLSGAQYLNHYLHPNFYFHVTTAYAILRHNGVGLGKMDFLGSLPFQEPTTQS